MKNYRKRTKAQSAMEYLMTYGWAILIIAVVLGALFSLGVFNSSSMLGTSCIPNPGYMCQNPVLNTAGTLSLTVGQATGSTYYNAVFYVAPQTSALNTYGFPSTAYAATPITSLVSGQTAPVTFNLGSSYTSIGTSFSGYVWLNYSSTAGGSASISQKIATLIVKVS
ncbi:MAG: hypothetical protein ACP5RT_01160 [Candidatus Micrarchaeia archaeon]